MQYRPVCVCSIYTPFFIKFYTYAAAVALHSDHTFLMMMWKCKYKRWKSEIKTKTITYTHLHLIKVTIALKFNFIVISHSFRSNSIKMYNNSHRCLYTRYSKMFNWTFFISRSKMRTALWKCTKWIFVMKTMFPV